MEYFKIENYFERLKSEDLVVTFHLNEKEKTDISGLTYNSKEVKEGAMFVCKGISFKQKYLKEAIAKGAVIYISETKFSLPIEIPYIIVKDIRRAMPLLGDMFYHSPSKKLNLIGVTGTKGKTTTINYVKAIIDEYLAAKKKKESGLISTIEIYDGKKRRESSLTTPEALEVQKILGNAVDSGLEFVEMEVSSQALKYNRVSHIQYEVGIFTNISEDHISPGEHLDFNDYFESKLKLFEQVNTAVINADADCYNEIRATAGRCRRVVIYGKEPENDIYGYDVRYVDEELHFCVKCDAFDEAFAIRIQGDFNVENALAAIGAAYVLNIPVEYISEGLKKAHINGRMELYTSQDKDIVVIVDYAHNKLSFEKLYTHAAKYYPAYQIVTIFGCPGGKAYNRREDLGTVAGQYSNKVYLVADDPGFEKPDDISREIAKYLEEKNCSYEIIEDRGKAIKQAIMKAKSKTLILVAGKGHERRQKYGDKYMECLSDAEYVKLFLEKPKKKRMQA